MPELESHNSHAPAVIRQEPPLSYPENNIDIREVVERLRKRKLLILIVAVISAVPALVSALLTTPLYYSSAIIQINPDPVQVLPYRDVADSGTSVYYEVYMSTQDQILRSPNLLSRVAAKLASDPNAALSAEASHLSGRFSVRRIPNSQLFQLGYRAPSPDVAAAVVNTFTEEFLKQHLESRQATREKAAESLQRQLESMEKRLQISEKGLVAYAQKQDIIRLGPAQGDLIQKRLATLDQQVADAESEVAVAQNRLDTIQKASANNFPEKLTTPVVINLSSRILQAEQELMNLRANFGENWPSVVAKRNEIDLLRDQLAREKALVVARETEQARLDLRAAQSKQNTMNSAYVQNKDLVARYNQALIEYNVQQREVDTNRRLYESLLERLSETSLQKGFEFGNVQILDPGRPNYQREGRRMWYTFAWASLMGLTLGVGAAFLRDYLDSSISTIEEAQRLTALPGLGTLPAHKYLAAGGVKRALPPPNGDRTKVLKLDISRQVSKPRGASAPAEVTEAARDICASILLSQSDSPLRVIVVTSAAPGEGKSTFVTEIGRVLADGGARTLLIEGDLRKPVLAESFGIAEGDGLSLFLSGHSPSPRICETDQPNMFIAPAGPRPPNPVALFSSDKMNALLRQVSSSFRFALIDTPPVLSVADARVLGAKADGVILVIRSGVTLRKTVSRARVVLQNSGVNLLGVVINGSTAEDLYATSYRRYYEHK